jgi:hypothetical protein
MMSGSSARFLVAMALAAAIALFNAGAIGRAVAESSVLPFAAPDGLGNRYDFPVSETDVERADHQHLGSIECDETPPIDPSRVFLAR